MTPLEQRTEELRELARMNEPSASAAFDFTEWELEQEAWWDGGARV